MCTKKLFVLLGVLFVAVTTVSAQLRITQGPRDLEGREYRVRIDSTQFGAPHTVGIFGRTKTGTTRISFDGGRTGPDVYTQSLSGGMRVVCVWNANGDVVFLDSLYVDRAGTLRIPAEAMMHADRAGGGLRID